MCKNLRVPLLLVTMLLSSIPIIAHDFEVDGIFYYRINDSEVKVSFKGTSPDEFYDEYVGTVTIPSSISYNGKKYNVTGISSFAFCDCKNLTSVTISNDYYQFEIGGYAFYGCTNLTSISIPSSATYIGSDAFYNTGWYNNQPNGILYLDNCCLGYKGTISSDISIKAGTSIIPYGVFLNCDNIVSVTLPNSIKHILPYAFHDNLKTVIIYNPTPPSIEPWVYPVCFGYNTTLYVPEESLSAYKSNPYWNYGCKILSIESYEGTIALAISVPNNLSLNIGEQTSIAVTVIPNTAKLTSISYSSSNSSVAKVSSSGVITALTAGTAKITVTGTSSNGNTLTATSTVNVIDNTRNPDLASGIYLSILGFNNDLYSYPFKQLSSWSKSGFESFINGLTTKNGTILYYSVEQALKQLKSSQYPTDISNISIVTFTDGLDQGSHMKNTSYGSDDAYLNAINNKINNELVSSLPVSAYSIGVVGDDVTDISKFRKNLQALASSADNAIEVSNMDEVNSKFQDIANKLIETSNIQTISVIMPGQANGTKVRFTFDGVSSASSSTLYIEGTFNLSDFSLNNITYKGMKATSGSKIIGEVVDGIFIKFTFEGIETDSKLTIQQQDINEWTYITSTSSWQVNSEFDKDEQSEIETRKQSAAVILVLDCSSSLGSQFTNVQQCANSFIATLAYHSVERNQDLLSMIGYDELIKVDGGTFMMGAQSGNSTGANYDTDAQSAESPVHQVTLDDFCIGKYEVTQRLWEYVMTYSGEAADGTKMTAYSGNVWPNGNPTSAYGLGDNHPAYNVSYQNIVNIFIPRLNQITGKSFRLPTEAEWEYAARGGLMSKGYKYSGSNTANSVAWSKSNSTLSQRVGMKSPNELGLYDMSGNVSEWCSSKYTNYSSSAQINPTDYIIENEQLQTKASSTPSISGGTGIITPSYSVRGGDYTGAISTCRVSSRSNSKSNQYYIGFRLALSIEPVKATKLTLDKTTATISVDEEIQLIATIEPGNTDNKSITWTSSDENVATVDENGVVTAISAGSVIITAKTSDGSNLSASCEIKVVTSSIEDIMNNNELYEVARYDLFGRKLSQPTKGINIIKMNDGSVLKQYVK